jgi:hypothetical protein
MNDAEARMMVLGISENALERVEDNWLIQEDLLARAERYRKVALQCCDFATVSLSPFLRHFFVASIGASPRITCLGQRGRGRGRRAGRNLDRRRRERHRLRERAPGHGRGPSFSLRPAARSRSGRATGNQLGWPAALFILDPKWLRLPARRVQHLRGSRRSRCHFGRGAGRRFRP